MRATKLVCTIGPASLDRVAELVAAGMDVARLNFSHARTPNIDASLVPCWMRPPIRAARWPSRPTGSGAQGPSG